MAAGLSITVPSQFAKRLMQVLLIEDNPGDIRLMREALNGHHNIELNVADNGEDALAYLHRQEPFASAKRPDIILLDLNLPRRDGREVLAEVKRDETLRRIPVIVLTTSQSENDVLKVYDLHANCYVQKPVDFDEYIRVIGTMEEFWFKVARLPGK